MLIQDLLNQINEIDNPCSMHGYRTRLADALHSMELNIEEAVGYASTARGEIESAEGYLEEAKSSADSAEEEAADAQKQYWIIRQELERFQGIAIEQTSGDPLQRLGVAIMAVVGMAALHHMNTVRVKINRMAYQTNTDNGL